MSAKHVLTRGSGWTDRQTMPGRGDIWAGFVAGILGPRREVDRDAESRRRVLEAVIVALQPLTQLRELAAAESLDPQVVATLEREGNELERLLTDIRGSQESVAHAVQRFTKSVRSVEALAPSVADARLVRLLKSVSASGALVAA